MRKRKTFKAPEGYLTSSQTMDKLGVGSSTLYRIIDERNFTGVGESIKFRGRRLFLKTAVDQYLQQRIAACY
ncbi:MAG: helix-turn-helix domain-containing protein [Tannerellaceae bacterium]|nr:helix-turn-helix domain-containing protein [Tannerellaceae bacterium]